MTARHVEHEAARAARPRTLAAIGAVLLVLFGGFLALGTWQLQRMGWKHALITRVESRIHAEPVAAPARAAWTGVTREGHEYLRVRAEGVYLADADTRVQAVTELGAGFWVMTPLRREDGDVVLVNRGFVPLGATASAAPAGRIEVSGLLRIDEPGGAFLRHNDPAGGRWYSRDVQAIAQARGLPATAPFFVDADRGATAAGTWPRGGMTVVRFRDPHLTYALTWFALAMLVALAGWRVVTRERGLRQHARTRRHGMRAHASTVLPPA
ncbi:SURF1 family protein [Dokdonella sp. MW10]|uniref:SURF1 family protein n=1 Tax=Dokdonella sp. MW10 TaxID=2992926 RepID=UPI003F7DF90C